MALLQIHEPGQTPAPHADEPCAPAVGIDLGTTHSVVSYIDGSGKAHYVLDEAGRTLHPSVVTIDGQEIRSIKRKLAVTPAEVVAGGKNPVQISAEILKHVKALTEHQLGREVADAVITVPAYFDDAARTATRDAARLAGLKVLRLVNEPTAAALAYGLDTEAEGIYAIYDLGGGTFDISILRLAKGVFQVLSTHGDVALGGDDFDVTLFHLSQWERSGSPKGDTGEGDDPPPKSKISSPPIGRGIRELKERLSTEESVEMNGRIISRTAFEQAIAPLVEKTLTACQQALEDAGLQANQVNGVVLVGGSTRVPLVRRRVEEFFGQKPHTDIDPDKVVALGAGLQAKALTKGSDTLLLDVTPLSLGLETMGGMVEKVIHRNSPIPVSARQEFTTYQDGQNAMLIHVLQGEREMVDQCRSLAKFTLRGIPPMVAGAARIEVTFTVDADGLLSVTAEEKTTGTQQSIEVKPSYGLPPEQIESMIRDSMQHAREDITARLLAEARLEANRLLQDLSAAMKESAVLLTEQEQKALPRAMATLETAVKGEDRDAIDAAHQQLERLAHAFAQRRMDSAIATALKHKKIDEVG